jgi:hypothetical protein
MAVITTPSNNGQINAKKPKKGTTVESSADVEMPQTTSVAGKPSVLTNGSAKKAPTPVNVKSLKGLEESDKEEEDETAPKKG